MDAMKPTVSIVPCQEYEKADASMEALLKPLGGMERFVSPGQRVLVKPNAVLASPPEKAICTHPAVVAAVCKRIVGLGATPVIAESPGGPYNAAWVQRTLEQSGIWPACKAVGAERNEDFGVEEVAFPEGAELKRMTLIRAVSQCDAVINVCKIKTHGMVLYSGAAKNVFGCVPGSLKNEAHVRFQKTERFAAQLNDVCLKVAPVLHVMDAIVGMEGDGPTSGTPRLLGALLASENPWALDHLACGLIELPPERVPVLQDAVARGLYAPADIQRVGEGPPPVRFRVPAQHQDARFGNSFIHFFLKRALQTHPVPKPGCVGCGICMERCPPKAIAMQGKRPVIDRRKCIHCYCCQELCPHGMMDIHRTWIANALQRRREQK